MIQPVRLQRRRAKGARLVSPNGLPIVYVGRGSRYGNPYKVVPCHDCYPNRCNAWLVVWWHREIEKWIPLGPCDARREHVVQRAIDAYRDDLLSGGLPFTVVEVERVFSVANAACWCPLPKPGEPDLCHGAVLLEIAKQKEKPCTKNPLESA